MFFFDYGKLLNRLNEAGKKSNYQMIGHLVSYYDEENESHPLTEEQYERNPVMSLFYKSKIFEHQKEFRLIIAKLLEKDEIISIGDIGDIAHNSGKVELNKSLGLEFGFKDSDEEALNK